MKQTTIQVGIILKGFGLKGELKIKVLTSEPQARFQPKQVLWLDQSEPLEVKTFRMHQDQAVVSFVGYPDLTSVEHLRGRGLWIDVKDIDVSDAVYFFELRGVEVFNEQNESLGFVEDVLDMPAHAVIRVKGEITRLIPYVDAFIVSFDKAQKKLIVRLIEGL